MSLKTCLFPDTLMRSLIVCALTPPETRLKRLGPTHMAMPWAQWHRAMGLPLPCYGTPMGIPWRLHDTGPAIAKRQSHRLPWHAMDIFFVIVKHTYHGSGLRLPCYATPCQVYPMVPPRHCHGAVRGCRGKAEELSWAMLGRS